MGNNSEKIMRDKLRGIEFPFENEAWEKMEALLDKKKKRRVLFWWWFSGGMAACVLLMGILFGIMNGKQQQEAAAGGKGKQVAVVKGNNEEKQQQKNNRSNQRTQKDKKTEQFPLEGLGGSEASEKNSATKNFDKGSTFAEVEKKGSRNHKNKQLVVKHKAETKKIAAAEVAAVSQTATRNPETRIENELAYADFLSSKNKNDAEVALNKSEEETTLPKQKKKIFHYSAGVTGHVTGTTLGKKDGGTVFCNKPSYMVGLTHDFLFVNRVAITNSILFSQTSFKVNHPVAPTFTKVPTSYTSHITELAIPIGIKVYPVVKNNFRFFINTGIINHIKLKETFDYTVPADTSALSLTSDITNFPPQTDFTQENKEYDALTQQVISSYSTKDFSINNAKRYYVSFYASAGFEYIAKKHFVLFGEPMFYMSLQKIGAQDKRKYNLGVAAGFRYQF